MSAWLPKTLTVLSGTLILLFTVLAYAETELEHSNRTLSEISNRFDTQRRADAPTLDNFPKPAGAPPSPAELSKQFSSMAIVQPKPRSGYDLFVFVSFSMPVASLVRVIEESERTGAHVVFRGFKGEKLTDMANHIGNLIGKHRVDVTVNPPAFTQYQVTSVPTLIIAQANAGDQLSTSGCAQAGRYVKVGGDVGQEYALDLIERTAPQWADVAHNFNQRLLGEK